MHTIGSTSIDRMTDRLTVGLEVLGLEIESAWIMSVVYLWTVIVRVGRHTENGYVVLCP